MAAKSGFNAGGVVGAVVALVAVVIGWKFLSSTLTGTTAQSMTGNSSTVGTNSLLNSLLSTLTGKSSTASTGTKSSSGMSLGSGSGAASYGSGSSQSNASVQQSAAAIRNANASALSTPNFQDLGGQSLANYVPVEPSDSTMTTVPGGDQTLQTLSNLPSYSLPDEPTTTSVDTGDTIPYEPQTQYSYDSLYEEDLAKEVAEDEAAYQQIQQTDDIGSYGDGAVWGDDGY